VELTFDRDRPLDFGTPGVEQAGGFEQPAAAERLTISGTSLSAGFQAGFFWRILGRVGLGGSFPLRPGGLSRGDIRVDQYDSGSTNVHVTGAQGTADGYGQIAYTLPDVVHLGARWLLRDRLEAGITFRYADWGQRSRALRLRMTSTALRE